MENYKTKHSNHQWDSNHLPSAYEAEAIAIAPRMKHFGVVFVWLWSIL